MYQYVCALFRRGLLLESTVRLMLYLYGSVLSFFFPHPQAFSPLSLRFSDPLTAVDQQFCIDTAQTVFSDIAAQKIGLGFSADSCVDFPAATFSLEASGSTIRVRINNAKAISVFGIQISGPAELESASLGALITDAGFQVIGVSPIIINSPSGSVLSPQVNVLFF